MVLEKTLESLLDFENIQPVNPKEYWSGLPFPSPGDFPYPGIKSGSPALQADSLPSELPGKCHVIRRLINNHCRDEGLCDQKT